MRHATSWWGAIIPGEEVPRDRPSKPRKDGGVDNAGWITPLPMWSPLFTPKTERGNEVEKGRPENGIARRKNAGRTTVAMEWRVVEPVDEVKTSGPDNEIEA